MTKVECTYGAAETLVGGITYKFARDDAGRYIADVHNQDHIDILTAVEHYRLADDEPSASVDIPRRNSTAAPPAAKRGRGRAKQPEPPVEPDLPDEQPEPDEAALAALNQTEPPAEPSGDTPAEAPEPVQAIAEEPKPATPAAKRGRGRAKKAK